MITKLFSKNVSTNEEFKEVLRAKISLYFIILLLGIITMGVSVWVRIIGGFGLEDYMQGVYCGVGGGLIGASLALIVKNKIILKSEEKIKKERLKNYDERNIAISQKALLSALGVLMVALYLMGLIGGLFNPILMRALSFLVLVFLVGYLVFYKIYFKKMWILKKTGNPSFLIAI